MTYQATRSKVETFLASVRPLWRRGLGEPYRQEVFRHLLSVERKRAEQSKRPLFVALVSLQSDMEPQRLSELAGAQIFSGLARCVREVDFIGWYRQDYVAGAVLIQGTATDDASVRVRDRVTRAICGYLPQNLHNSVRVRVSSVNGKAGD